MKKYPEILAQLPYQQPFLFVDELEQLDANGATGTYQFKEDEFFYAGHFKDKPITPGVILTECAAQIGLVCLGIFLNQGVEARLLVLSESDMLFKKVVLPGDTVTVKSEKIYWRMGKLKCKVIMHNAQKETICQGTLSGMITKNV
jgi:3-hydroxyacyl-[acyl-carrier-protein] dehydratase